MIDPKFEREGGMKSTMVHGTGWAMKIWRIGTTMESEMAVHALHFLCTRYTRLHQEKRFYASTSKQLFVCEV